MANDILLSDADGTFPSTVRAGEPVRRTRTAADLAALPLAMAAYVQAQALMSTAGQVSWIGSNPNGRLRWTQRLVCIPVAQRVCPAGFFSIDQPTAPIPAAQVYDGADRAADATGIVLKPQEALYAVHAPGGGPTAFTFRIVSNTAPFEALSNWLLIAGTLYDGYVCRLGWGPILRPGATWSAQAT